MTPFLLADRADVVVLDDQRLNLHLLVDLLSPEFNVHPYTDAAAMLDYVRRGQPVDLIMLDILMPGVNGHEVCRLLRAEPELDDVPIIFITAMDQPEDEAHGLALGAADYVSKPFSAPIVLARVRHQVRSSRAMRLVVSLNADLDRRVAERTTQLSRRNEELQAALERMKRLQDATIVALTDLAGLRDEETGMHVQRTRAYVRALALALRERDPALAPSLDDGTIDLLYKSAPLHDIGKVAIPDHILRKPTRLDAEEFELMKTHARIGHDALRAAQIALGESDSFLRFACEITLGHHERWDGQGYPQALAGDAIPLSARLMAVADVYDALVSRRAYKEGLDHAEAVRMITAESGRHFDPRVVEAFLQVADTFAIIATTWSHAPDRLDHA
ncbi:MAG: hypothetical protein RL722_1623 [Pseudomonadota bacterium]|jgi:putative two-component system response regulator